MTHISSDGSNQAPLVATGTPVPGTDAQTYKASDGSMQEALPVQGAGETGGGPVEWGDVQNKPATYPPNIGTTATTAKAGNYVPSWSDVTDKPTTFPPTLGTTSITAKRGDYAPTWTEVTSKPAVIASGATAEAARAVIDAIGNDQKGVPDGVAPLDSSGLVPLEHLNVSGLAFKGPWNPATNTPELLDGTGSVGDFYKSTGSGTYDFGSGPHTFVEGDWIIFAAGVWQRIGVHETVASVNGKTGTIVLNAADVGAMPSSYTAPVTSVNGKSGVVALNAADVSAKPSSYVPAWSEVTGKPDFAPKHRGVISPPIPAAHRSLSVGQSIPASTVTKITGFSSGGFDQFGILSSGNITIPSFASHARITANIKLQGITETQHTRVTVQRGETVIAEVTSPGIAGITLAVVVDTGVVPVSSGQVYSVHIWHTHTAARNVWSGAFVSVDLFEAN